MRNALFLFPPDQQSAVHVLDRDPWVAQFGLRQGGRELPDGVDQQGVQLSVVYAFEGIFGQFVQHTAQAAAQHQGASWLMRNEKHWQVDNLFTQSHVRYRSV